jgi:thiol:disulfide interchange protein
MKPRGTVTLALWGVAVVFFFGLDLRFFTWLGMPWLCSVWRMLFCMGAFFVAQHYILERWTADNSDSVKQPTKPWR